MGTPSGYNDPYDFPPTIPVYTAPPKRRKAWPWVVGGLLVTVALVCGLGTFVLGVGAKSVNDEIQGTKNDVSLVSGSCKADTLGWKAEVQIKNSGKSDRSYWVQINLDKGTTRLGEGHVIVNNLKPGQTVVEEATGSGKFQEGATCSIGDVN